MRGGEEFTPSMQRLRDEYVQMRTEWYGFADLYASEFDRALAAHEAEVKADALREFAEYVTRVGEDGKRIRSETHGWWANAHDDLRTICALHDGWMSGRPAHDLLAAAIQSRADALSASTGDGRLPGRDQDANAAQGQPAGSDGHVRGIGDGTRDGDGS